MFAIKLIVCALAGYALGNFSTGILVGKLFAHKDIREVGSGSSGSTNVIRSFGLLPGLLTVAGDFLKGLAAALIGQALCGTAGLLVCGIASVIGHDYPALFGFKGGKGIITSLGVILVIEPWLAPTLFLLELLIAVVTKYMSVGAIIIMLLFPAAIVFLFSQNPDFLLLLAGSLVISALAIFRHKANIVRLIQGKESRFEAEKILKSKRPR